MTNARHILLADSRWLHVASTAAPHPDTEGCEGLSINAPPSGWASRKRMRGLWSNALRM